MTIATLIEKFKEDISWLGHNETEREIAEHIKHAITLLKKHEPIKPEMFDVGDGWIDCYCGNCKRELLSFTKSLNIELPKYCNRCGQAVKWDDF